MTLNAVMPTQVIQFSFQCQAKLTGRQSVNCQIHSSWTNCLLRLEDFHSMVHQLTSK